MKTCPVCNAKSFDDMEVCYGCLHRFADDENSTAKDFDNGQPEALQVQDSLVSESPLDKEGQSSALVAKDSAPAPTMMAVPAIAVVPPHTRKVDCEKNPSPSMLVKRIYDDQPLMHLVMPGGWSVQIEVPDFSAGVVVRCDKRETYA